MYCIIIWIPSISIVLVFQIIKKMVLNNPLQHFAVGGQEKEKKEKKARRESKDGQTSVGPSQSQNTITSHITNTSVCWSVEENEKGPGYCVSHIISFSETVLISIDDLHYNEHLYEANANQPNTNSQRLCEAFPHAIIIAASWLVKCWLKFMI